MQNYFIPTIILLAGVIISIVAKKLTVAGAITGGVVGFCVYLGAGYIGLILLATFFVLGTAATSWEKNLKIKLGIAQENKGRRTAGQVFANGGIAGLCGLFAFFFRDKNYLFLLMMTASLSSATADTLSSELGSIYGTRFFNILTLKKDHRGLDGVVSVEGILIGIIGSAIIATIYSLGFGWSKNFLFIIIAGTVGNIIDSILGAALERKNIINNDAVNLFNTIIAAFIIYLLVIAS